MSTKFFTNKDGSSVYERISQNIDSLKDDFNLFRVVVGFFRSSGYFEVQKLMKPSVRKIQILIGINADAATLAAHKEAVGKEYKDDVQKAPNTTDAHSGMQQFVNDIRSGRLELRMHKTQKIHAKFFLMLPEDFEQNQDCDSRVLMGSSNMSRTALGISGKESEFQYELNVIIKDYDDVKFCNEEFKRLWEDSVDISDAILEASSQTWLEPRTPQEIYYKMLIHRFGYLIEDQSQLELPEGMMNLKYQEFAAKDVYYRLMKHNGCFLGDVVGLGKTVVAAMVSKRFIYENGANTKILLVIPPAVQMQWEDTLNEFNIRNNFTIVTNGSLDHIGKNNLPAAEFYDMVIVDESHGFRNSNNERYKLLYDICHMPRAMRGNVEGDKKKILLLSATIFNNYPNDIKNQVLLFQSSRDNTIEGVDDIEQVFKHWTKRHKDLQNDNAKPEEIDKLYQEIREKVLSQVCIRRTRSNIENDPVFCKDLEAQGIKFPKIEPPTSLEYTMPNKYKACFFDSLALLTENEEKDGIHYARYRAIEFLKGDKKTRFPNAENSAKNLTGIYKVLMVKRLESSVEAFKQSLGGLLDSTRHMIEMMQNDRVLIIGDLNVEDLLDQGFEIDDILKKAEDKGLNISDLVYSKEDFEPKLYQMLQDDEKKLAELLERWQSLSSDPKLERFVDCFPELLNVQTNPTGKLVIFSESVDTVKYLKCELEKRLGRSDILEITSANRNSCKAQIRENFDANVKDEEQRDDFNIIIATEVLSEGINLHRANVIVNYDTPWNASRLIQRIGRVNRIGSVAGSILNYVFYPTKEAEDQINLYKNALTKLQAVHSLLGEDSQIFSREEMLKEFNLYSEKVDIDSTDREAEFRNELLELYKNKREQYNKIKTAVPDRAYTACKLMVPQTKGTSVALLKNSTKSEYFFINENSATPIDFIQAAQIMRQHKDCARETLDMNLYMKHTTDASVSFGNRSANLFGEPEIKTSANVDKLLKLLRDFSRQDAALHEGCDALSEVVRKGNSTLERELKKLLNSKTHSDTEIAALLKTYAKKYATQALDLGLQTSDVASHSSSAVTSPDVLLSETFV